MRKLVVIPVCLLLVTLPGCFLSQKHRDDLVRAWIKSADGRYNRNNALKLEKSNKWIETIAPIPGLKTMRVLYESAREDKYLVNDSTMFFDLKNTELPTYLSYHTFAKRLGITPKLMKKIVSDFDELGLNRFYREDEFIAFLTVTGGMESPKGYFYFFDRNSTPYE